VATPVTVCVQTFSASDIPHLKGEITLMNPLPTLRCSSRPGWLPSLAFGAAALAVVLFGAGGAQANNLVVNGSFELPALTTQNFVHIPAGSSFLTGWTVTSSTTGAGVDLVNARTFGANYAFHGFQGLDMAGTPGPGTISQVVSVVPGFPYTLSFAVSSNGGPFTNALTVFFDGQDLGTFNTPAFGTWQVITLSVTPTNAQAQLQFRGNRGGNTGALLDDVRLVPGPGAGPLLAVLGVGGVGAWRRRRP
jgi:MYXO-CTERM domain-containing protein